MSYLTEALAMDCEMVGAGPKGRISMCARVSLVNEHGQCVFDTFIRPNKKVTDYRTFVSGITPGHLAQGRPFDVVKQEVARFIKGRILVGHSVDKDLRALGLCHPEWNIRDTAHYPPFQTDKGTPSLKYLAWTYLGSSIQNGSHSSVQRKGSPSLKYLAAKYLGWFIQNGPHSSVQDTRVAMALYNEVQDEWEEFNYNYYNNYDYNDDYNYDYNNDYNYSGYFGDFQSSYDAYDY